MGVREMALLDQQLLDQLKEVFNRLEKNIKIINFVDENIEKSVELKGFLEEFSTTSDKIIIENTTADDKRYTEFGINRLPALAFVNENNEFTGNVFYGIPGGHEINSFVITILNLANAGKPLNDNLLKRISEIDKEITLQVFVTLACHHCPDVVVNTQHAAIKNKNIKAEMIDISLFPEIAKENGVRSVPTVVYNGNTLTVGAKSLDDILDKLNEHL